MSENLFLAFSIQCHNYKNHNLIIAVDHKTYSVRMNVNLKLMTFMSNYLCHTVLDKEFTLHKLH